MRPLIAIAAMAFAGICNGYPYATHPSYVAPQPAVPYAQPVIYTPPQPAGVWVPYRRPNPVGDLLFGPIWIWMPVHQCQPQQPLPQQPQ